MLSGCVRIMSDTSMLPHYVQLPVSRTGRELVFGRLGVTVVHGFRVRFGVSSGSSAVASKVPSTN